MPEKIFLYFLCILVVLLVLTEIEAECRQITKPYSTTSKSNYTRKHTLKKRNINVIQPKYCSVNYEDKRKFTQNDPNLTTIYFVTATYPRPDQVADLLRLSHTLMHVPHLHWILADENVLCSVYLLRILKRSGLPFTHISVPKLDFKSRKPFPRGLISQGAPNHKAGLNWIRRHIKEGILYFGDDENTYDLDLFREIRKTKKLSMVPVGLVGLHGVSSPIVANGSVIAFFESWFLNRKFPVVMAGFAVNIKHLKPTADMPTENVTVEDGFLTSAGFEIEDIEPLADNCTKVLVWHTRTEKYEKLTLQADMNFIKSSKYKSVGILLDSLLELHVLELNLRTGTQMSIIENKTIFYNWGYNRPNASNNKHKYITPLPPTGQRERSKASNNLLKNMREKGFSALFSVPLLKI